MARGNDAKDKVVETLAAAFGEDWIGLVDKKYYVWAKEGNERLQIAISLTCPKTNVDTGDAVQTVAAPKPAAFDWSDQGMHVPDKAAANEISKEEQDNIEALLARLGL